MIIFSGVAEAERGPDSIKIMRGIDGLDSQKSPPQDENVKG